MTTQHTAPAVISSLWADTQAAGFTMPSDPKTYLKESANRSSLTQLNAALDAVPAQPPDAHDLR